MNCRCRGGARYFRKFIIGHVIIVFKVDKAYFVAGVVFVEYFYDHVWCPICHRFVGYSYDVGF